MPASGPPRAAVTIEPDDTGPDERAGAREWASSHIASEPWSEVAGRAALLLVAPPLVEWELPPEARPHAWLVLEAGEARALPQPQREPLLRLGALVEEGDEGRLTVTVLEGLDHLLDAVTRPALEARWLLNHAEAVHDPLRRLETLAQRASTMPPGAMARAVRPLYLQLISALHGLDSGGIAAAGETAASIARLVCTLDGGGHPPLDWLAEAARRTLLGPRLGVWFDDLPRAAAGDEAAQRRVLAARAGVRRAVTDMLRQNLGTFDWLTAPEAYLLRTPR